MAVTAQNAAQDFDEILTVAVEESTTKRVLGTGVGQLTRVPNHEEWGSLDRELWGESLDETTAS